MRWRCLTYKNRAFVIVSPIFMKKINPYFARRRVVSVLTPDYLTICSLVEIDRLVYAVVAKIRSCFIIPNLLNAGVMPFGYLFYSPGTIGLVDARAENL